MKKKKKTTGKIPEWERLLSAQVIFQARFPESVIAGGTAAALHAKHRISLDADYILPNLKKTFEKILKKVEEEAGWSTKRLKPPVLILGHFQGVRVGIRQLVRSAPLETTFIKGLKVPTKEEILRIKAYLIVRRNATRDFIDFIALYDYLGGVESLKALESLDLLYPQEDKGSISQQLILQLAEPKPWDLMQTDLSNYKALQEPYTKWEEIRRRLFSASQRLTLKRME